MQIGRKKAITTGGRRSITSSCVSHKANNEDDQSNCQRDNHCHQQYYPPKSTQIVTVCTSLFYNTSMQTEQQIQPYISQNDSKHFMKPTSAKEHTGQFYRFIRTRPQQVDELWQRHHSVLALLYIECYSQDGKIAFLNHPWRTLGVIQVLHLRLLLVFV